MVFNQKLVAVIRVNGKVLREQNVNNGSGEVFIPFESEYSIELKNLHSTPAHVQIEIDGEDALDGCSLVVSPNQKTNLERFIIDSDLSKGPKFKFIEKTDKISEYRGDNVEDGIINIWYKFEKPVNKTDYRINHNTYNKNFVDHFHNIYSENEMFSTYNDQVSYNSSSYIARSICHVPSQNITSDTISSFGKNEYYIFNGITVPGEESNQSFTIVSKNNIVFEDEEHSIAIHLKGKIHNNNIEQPLLVKTKLECSTCGTKNSSNSKFCSECGTNLKY